MIAAVGMVKDEADVITRTLEHLGEQGVDVIYLAENASTDGTWEIVRDLRDAGALRAAYGTQLVVMADPEIGYWQSRKMTDLARYALAEGARWIVPFDADELWHPSPGYSTLRELFLDLDLSGRGVVLEASVHNHYRTTGDGGGHPFDAMRWRDPVPLSLPKVAFTAHPAAVVHAGNHGVDHAGSRLTGALTVEHYPYRSPEQFVRKVRNGSAAYAATDLPRSTGQHWREYGELLAEHGAAAVREHYQNAFVIDDPEARGLELT